MFNTMIVWMTNSMKSGMISTNMEAINYIKEKQREYEVNSATYNALRDLEMVLPGLFKKSHVTKFDDLNEEEIKSLSMFIDKMLNMPTNMDTEWSITKMLEYLKESNLGMCVCEK